MGEEGLGRRTSAPKGSASGEGSPSARLGDLDLPLGLKDRLQHRVPPCHSPGETSGSSGEGSGCLFTSSSSAHACTHMHTHVLTPSHAPQTEPLIPLICRITANQPALPRSLPLCGQICTRRFPYPPPPGCH